MMLKNKILLIGILLSSSLFASTAEELINSNGCLSCHAVASKKLAPAFAGIAMRNKRREGSLAKETIMNSIKNGSSGKYRMFSNSAMPAYSNLSEAELNIIADYILEQASKARGHGGQGQGRGMR
jgi:cytochrome c